MSGRRCKALRRAYINRYGKAPTKTFYEGKRWGIVSYTMSTWRRLKKAYKRNPKAFL